MPRPTYRHADGKTSRPIPRTGGDVIKAFAAVALIVKLSLIENEAEIDKPGLSRYCQIDFYGATPC